MKAIVYLDDGSVLEYQDVYDHRLERPGGGLSIFDSEERTIVEIASGVARVEFWERDD